MSYRKVEPRMWDDERFATLTKDGKLTWLCVLTGPHTTSLPGLFVCGLATLSESMRDDIDTVSKAVRELSAAGMLRFNSTVRVVQVPNAPKYNPCPNPKVLKGWLSVWKSVPDCAEKYDHVDRLRDALDAAQPWVAGAWAETFGAVKVPDRYRIATVSETVPISVAATVAAAATEELSGAPPAAPTGAPLELTPPKAKAKRPAAHKPAPPFSVAEALNAIASTAGRRFTTGDATTWAPGWKIAIAQHVRRFPDLATWRLVGEWLSEGGASWAPTHGPQWAASNHLLDAITKSQAWASSGRGVVDAKAAVTPHLHVVAPPSSPVFVPTPSPIVVTDPAALARIRAMNARKREEDGL